MSGCDSCHATREQVRHLTAENLRMKERWYDANCVIRRLAALPARWRNHYADRVADAVASACADDVDEVLQALRGDGPRRADDEDLGRKP